MAEKFYKLYCEICGYKRFTDGTDIQDLIPYKRSPVATGIPKLDPVTKKTTVKSPMNLPKQFKCPKCGRLITPKKYVLPTEEKHYEENQDAGSETGSA